MELCTLALFGEFFFIQFRGLHQIARLYIGGGGNLFRKGATRQL